MKKLIVLAPVLSSVLALTGCGGVLPGNSLHSISYHIELWGSNFETTSDGHCTGTDSNYQNNRSVNLVGPDGKQISSATFSFGVLQPTTMEESSVTNFPTEDICDFSVTFPDVPNVATYRIQTADGGISPVSNSRSQVIARSWSIGVVRGANVKQ